MLSVMNGWASLVSGVSFEWIFKWLKRPNGGDIKLFRSLAITVAVLFVTILFDNLLDSHTDWSFDLEKLRSDLRDFDPLFGATFAGTYAALHTRLSSQWRCLADLYNKIHETEAKTGCNPTVMACWKASFLEDAQEFHLATKGIFSSAIRAWAGEAEVRSAFIDFTPGGEDRFGRLLSDVNRSIELAEARYGKSSRGSQSDMS